jgi:hypothetical protein
MSMMDSQPPLQSLSDQGADRSSDTVIQLQGVVQQLSALVQTFKAVFPQQGSTTTSATAGAATLPANPVGFINVTLLDGTAVKVPYYNV